MKTSENDVPNGHEERSDRTVQGLCEAARTAFARVGYAAASVRDIAGSAGVNPALVRYHFGSKEALYRRVLDDAMGQLRDRLIAALERPGTPRQRIHRVIASYLDHLAANPDTPRLIQRALLDHDPNIRLIVGTHHGPLVRALEPFLEGVDAHRADLEEAVTSLFGALVAPFLYAPLLGQIFGRDVLTPEAIERRREHIASLVDLTHAHILSLRHSAAS